VIFRDLKEVEEASGLGKLIIIEKSGVSLGQIVRVILPVDFDGLQSKAKEGERFAVVCRNASQYLRLNVQVPAEGSLGIGDTPLIFLLTINIW